MTDRHYQWLVDYFSYTKAFCRNIFPSVSQQVRTVIVWDLYYGQSAYLLVSEPNNARITVQIFFQQQFWVAEPCMAACFTQVMSTAIFEHFSHGSVATCLRCGWIVNDDFVAHLLLNLSVKERWKSVAKLWTIVACYFSTHGVFYWGLYISHTYRSPEYDIFSYFIKVWRPTWHKIDHFKDDLLSQYLGLLLKNKPSTTNVNGKITRIKWH